MMIDLEFIANELHLLELDLHEAYRESPFAIYAYMELFSDLSGSIIVEMGRDSFTYSLHHTLPSERIKEQFGWIFSQTITKIRKDLLT